MTLERTGLIEAQVLLGFDLKFDETDLLHILPSIQTIGDLEPDHADPVTLEEMVDGFIERHSSVGDYPSIYCMSHELRRMAERGQDVAEALEDSSNAYGDLLDDD